jgi:hypothetical protein
MLGGRKTTQRAEKKTSLSFQTLESQIAQCATKKRR